MLQCHHRHQKSWSCNFYRSLCRLPVVKKKLWWIQQQKQYFFHDSFYEFIYGRYFLVWGELVTWLVRKWIKKKCNKIAYSFVCTLRWRHSVSLFVINVVYRDGFLFMLVQQIQSRVKKAKKRRWNGCMQ